MKRPTFNVALHVAGELVAEDTAYAFNSATRRSTALVRSYARSLGRIFEGDKPSRVGNDYTRVWRSGETVAVATVRSAGMHVGGTVQWDVGLPTPRVGTVKRIGEYSAFVQTEREREAGYLGAWIMLDRLEAVQ